MTRQVLLFRELLSKYCSLIEHMLSSEAITSIFEFEDAEKNTFMKKYIKAFRSHMEGGKRLRAFLVILGYNMCNNETDENIISASLSYELFQNGVLIHDDIIDQSDLRRNKPSMYVAFGNNQAGISKAICVGDLGIITASDTILSSKFEASRKLEAIANQSRIFQLTIAGELKDIELSEMEEYSLEDIIKMYELKTSWYTFIGPLQLGIILGGGGRELLTHAENIGRLIGIAFQIRDDLTGIYGKKNVTGKSNTSDIEEGKKTILTSYFENKASSEQKKEFDSIYGKGKCDEIQSSCIRNLFDESGAHAFAKSLYEKYIDEAMKAISQTDISPFHKDILYGLLEYLNEDQS